MLQKETSLAAILALFLILPACGGSAQEAPGGEASEALAPAQTISDTPRVEPTSTEDASGEATSADSIDIAEHLSEKTMHLWEVYNTYDPDALKAFYEEDYWNEKVEQIRLDMQPFKNRGMTFAAEETSPPTEIASGKWEIKHTARFTGGSVNIVFIYENFGGQWLLTYAEAQ